MHTYRIKIRNLYVRRQELDGTWILTTNKSQAAVWPDRVTADFIKRCILFDTTVEVGEDWPGND